MANSRSVTGVLFCLLLDWLFFLYPDEQMVSTIAAILPFLLPGQLIQTRLVLALQDDHRVHGDFLLQEPEQFHQGIESMLIISKRRTDKDRHWLRRLLPALDPAINVCTEEPRLVVNA